MTVKANNGWWSGTLEHLSQANPQEIADRLAGEATERGIPGTPEQQSAWEQSVGILVETAKELLAFEGNSNWGVIIEFELPRRAVRPDAVFLIRDVIVPIEFKVGSDRFDRGARLQAAEYARDLNDFHEASHGRAVIPVLVATKSQADDIDLSPSSHPYRVQCVGPSSICKLLLAIRNERADSIEQIAIAEWSSARYRPTLGILEAARDVYAGNQVREFSLSYADNLDATVDALRSLIEQARGEGKRFLCLVTGVPGSGKTLAGLSAIHEQAAGLSEEGLGAYLSGNGPLVKVLRYAIASDLYEREEITRSEANHRASVYIQPVHRFFAELAKSGSEPVENVVVFDEAQRAWSQEMMEKKQDIDSSEAAVTLSIMERKDWAVIVALVGEGQEINRGEAGIDAWIEALAKHPGWELVAPPGLADGASDLADRSVTELQELHLDVSVRSPRAKAIADWADALTRGEIDLAEQATGLFSGFPIFLTRDLEEMRSYLRDVASPDTRSGLLASAQARRLRPFGIEMAAGFHEGVDWGRWFVDPPGDIRSSYALEVAASEFSCQGLELDWVGLCWGTDFTWDLDSGDWRIQKLRGSKWVKDNAQAFARNRYRVLLTRARVGMVIWVPRAEHKVPLVDLEALDVTAGILEAAGCQPL